MKSDIAAYDAGKLKEASEKELARIRDHVDDIVHPIGVYREMRMNYLMKYIANTDWAHPFKEVQLALNALENPNENKDISRNEMIEYSQAFSEAVHSLDLAKDPTSRPRVGAGVHENLHQFSVNLNAITIAHRGIPMSWHEVAQGKPEKPQFDY